MTKRHRIFILAYEGCQLLDVTGPAEVFAMAREAMKRTLGMRHFDTAPLYGHGLAETRLGEALAARPRDSYVLATKVGRLLRPVTASSVASPYYKGTRSVEPHFDFSYDGVMTSLEESLARLEVDRVDILHIHDPDVHYDAARSGAC